MSVLGHQGREGSDWLLSFSPNAPIGSFLGAGDAIGGRLASREGLGRCCRPGTPGPLAVWPPEWVSRRQVVSVALLQLTASLPGSRGFRVLGWRRGVEVSPRLGVVSGSPGGERNAGPAFHRPRLAAPSRRPREVLAPN